MDSMTDWSVASGDLFADATRTHRRRRAPKRYGQHRRPRAEFGSRTVAHLCEASGHFPVVNRHQHRMSVETKRRVRRAAPIAIDDSFPVLYFSVVCVLIVAALVVIGVHG